MIKKKFCATWSNKGGLFIISFALLSILFILSSCATKTEKFTHRTVSVAVTRFVLFRMLPSNKAAKQLRRCSSEHLLFNKKNSAYVR